MFRGVAQLAERPSPKRKAIGSKPITPAKLKQSIILSMNRAAAETLVETVKIIKHPAIFAATDNWQTWQGQLAQNFSESWSELARLPVSLEEAREKVSASRRNTFVLIDQAEPDIVSAQVHPAPDGFNTAVCYSINRNRDRKIVSTENGVLVHKAIWLIKHLPFPDSVRIIAYSYMPAPATIGFFHQNLDQPKRPLIQKMLSKQTI